MEKDGVSRATAVVGRLTGVVGVISSSRQRPQSWGEELPEGSRCGSCRGGARAQCKPKGQPRPGC